MKRHHGRESGQGPRVAPKRTSAPGPRPCPAAQTPFAAGQPAADAFAGLTRQRFPPAGGLGGTIQRLLHPNAAQSNPSARGPALTHAVAMPKFHRVEAEVATDDV